MKSLLTFLMLAFVLTVKAGVGEGQGKGQLTLPGTEQVSMKVQGTKLPCKGFDGNTSCFQVQKGASIGTDFWEILPEPIAGFEFEAGYTYLITVKITLRENPAEGQSEFIYELVQVVSKTAE